MFADSVTLFSQVLPYVPHAVHHKVPFVHAPVKAPLAALG
jgi:hypothetical protein